MTSGNSNAEGAGLCQKDRTLRLIADPAQGVMIIRHVLATFAMEAIFTALDQWWVRRGLRNLNGRDKRTGTRHVVRIPQPIHMGIDDELNIEGDCGCL